VGPQIQFTSESFVDEIAAAIGADPVARLRYLTAPRDITVVKAAAWRGIVCAPGAVVVGRSGRAASLRAQRSVSWSSIVNMASIAFEKKITFDRRAQLRY